MTLDPFFLDAILGELNSLLKGAVVNKVHQPGPSEIIIRFWNGRRNLRLFVSASPAAPRIYFTEEAPPNPRTPPRFAQLLRSRLGRLTSIDRLPGQRIARLHFSDSEGKEWILVADLRGPRSDLLLLDREGRVVESLLRRGKARPGEPYEAPPVPPGQTLLEKEMPAAPPEAGKLANWLMDNVSPMSEVVAADLQAMAEGGAEPKESLEHLRARWRRQEVEPAVVHWKGKNVLCAWVPEALQPEKVTTYSSPSVAAQTFYREATAEGVFGAGPSELGRIVRKAAERLRRRLRMIEADRVRAQGSERERELGDLLLANLHRLRKGMTQVELEDWYADPPAPVTIDLDPALSPQANAELRFRRHRKGSRALEHVERRRRETLAELEWLEGLALALDQIADEAELEEVRKEMESEGLLRRRRERAAVSRPSGPAVRKATTPGGFTVYWGRNNRANDHVTRHLTAGEDLWFHAHDLPGCHLVLKRRNRGETVPEDDILAAAATAAANSRGAKDSKVEVMVTEGKEVRKPKGARPGAVVVGRYRTVNVEPREIDSSSPE